MRFLLEILGRRLEVRLDPADDEAPDPEPQGSTCGVLERVPSWDHDQRVPLGFAASARPIPKQYGPSKES